MFATLFLSIASIAALFAALVPAGAPSRAHPASIAHHGHMQNGQFECPPGTVPSTLPPYCI